jgi:hypothetical protein
MSRVVQAHVPLLHAQLMTRVQPRRAVPQKTPAKIEQLPEGPLHGPLGTDS